jgi:hypothetical protein
MRLSFLNLSKRHFIPLLFCFFWIPQANAQFCNGAGNVMVFSNYDGSGNTAGTRLNINVDVNIPNLKIGISSYERVTVNIAGTQVACVTAVRFAGYGATNNHCSSVAATVITGVPIGIITYVTNPPATVSDPLGNTSIIGGYACTLPNGTGNGGGSASMYQICNYFLSAFGAGSTLRSGFSQYGCWAGVTHAVSSPTAGNCCPLVPAALPLDLLSFEQSCDDNQTALHWATASESNTQFFTIEKSVNGIEFFPVADINASGNSDELKQYSWTDSESNTQSRFYRLSQTDNNGNTNYYSPLRATVCGNSPARLTILSQPTESALTIQYLTDAEDEKITFTIQDSYGNQRLVKGNNIAMAGTNIFMIDIASLSGGAYVLTAANERQSHFAKFIKY